MFGEMEKASGGQTVDAAALELVYGRSRSSMPTFAEPLP